MHVEPERYNHLSGIIIQVGEDPDVDSAFDDAVASAHDAIGHSGIIPSVADADPSSVQAVDVKAMPLDVAVTQALRTIQAKDYVAGTLHALPVGGATFWKRKKITLKIDDPSINIGAAGEVAELTPELEEYLKTKLVEAGEDLDGAQLELVEVRSMRSRWKPEVTTRKGTRAAKYVVVVKETGEVVGEGRTAGDARRAAVAVAKAGNVGTLEHYTLEIEQRTRLVEGPVIEVVRTRITQKGTVRVTLAYEKDPAKTKTVAWLFYGTPATSDTTPDETVSEEE